MESLTNKLFCGLHFVFFQNTEFLLQGCAECNTKRGCGTEESKNNLSALKNELNLRSKALSDSQFPDKELINEFLVQKDSVVSVNVQWNMPSLIGFVVRHCFTSHTRGINYETRTFRSLR